MQRFVLGLPLAGLVTAALFVLMYGMILPGEIIVDGKTTERPYIPAPPERYEPAPPVVERPANLLPDAPPVIQPVFSGPSEGDFSRLAVSPARPDDLHPESSASLQGLFPLMTMSPAFPPGCQARGTEGFATVRFDVTLGGQVTNAVIADSSSRCFERAALDAIRAWRYQPAMTTEQGYLARGVTKRFAFKLQ